MCRRATLANSHKEGVKMSVIGFPLILSEKNANIDFKGTGLPDRCVTLKKIFYTTIYHTFELNNTWIVFNP